jgi:hypothetical protein
MWPIGCPETSVIIQHTLRNKPLILRCVHKTTVAVEKQYHIFLCVGVSARVRECACARVALLNNQATCPHIVICGLPGSTTFFEILINDMVFGRKLLHKNVFRLSLLLFETYIILRRIQRDSITNVKTCACKVPVILVRC